MKNLEEFVEPGHACFATFSEGRSSANTRDSHSHANFNYTRGEMEAFGADNGWSATYLGDWGHPRQQFMVKYEVV